MKIRFCLLTLALGFAGVTLTAQEADDLLGPAPASMDRIKAKLEVLNASSTGVKDVVKMHQAGLDKAVIKSYIDNSRMPAPTANDLIYLHDQGVPQELITTIVEHSKAQSPAPAQELAQNAAPAQQAQPAPQPTYTAPAGPVIIESSTPQFYPNYSSVYIYPYYPYRTYWQNYYSAPYSSYCYPAVSVYGGWGYGYGGWYGRSYPYRSYYHSGGFRSYGGIHAVPYRGGIHSGASWGGHRSVGVGFRGHR